MAEPRRRVIRSTVAPRGTRSVVATGARGVPRGARVATGRTSRTTGTRSAAIARQRQRQRQIARSRRRPGRAPTATGARTAAQGQLRRFRQGTRLAVALTALLLLTLGLPTAGGQQVDTAIVADTVTLVDTTLADDSLAADSVLDDSLLADSLGAGEDETAVAVGEATGTLREMARQLRRAAPKVLIAIGLIAIAALLARFARAIARRALGSWERGDAIGALIAIGIWLAALAAALAVIAGDARTVVGSLGLVGLALSWALQAPIESFTGWLLNSFRGYYRVGDRMAVGDVFGDVYRIDVLTTTVWEAGGPGKSVQGAQPTGALITFPNSEVLRANIVNYTRDFDFVWDEVVVGVTNESDLRLALTVLHETATTLFGSAMSEPAHRYASLLTARGIEREVVEEPQVYVSAADAWTDLTIRYLVPARERRKWASELTMAVAESLARPEVAARVKGSYPTQRVSIIRPLGETAPAADQSEAH